MQKRQRRTPYVVSLLGVAAAVAAITATAGRQNRSSQSVRATAQNAVTLASASEAVPAVASSAPKRLASPVRVPGVFEPNVGQTDKRVSFVSRGRGYSLFLTPQEAVLSLVRPDSSKRKASAMAANVTRPKASVLRMRFAGSAGARHVTGLDRAGSFSNYYLGNDRAKWRSGVPNYRSVRAEGVYPGTDVRFHGDGGELEYDFELAPHADPRAVAVSFDGAQSLTLDQKGNLLIDVPGGQLVHHRPVIYQMDGDRRIPVDGEYELRDGKTVGFRIAAYDAARPLVIDPTLSYSTYLGGSSNDYGTGVAVDSSGNIYLTGATASTNFPTVSPVQSSNAGGQYDVFITKINAAGSSLAFSTYLGGSLYDYGRAITLDSSGYVCVTGDTNSTNFPVTTNALQSSLGGNYDAIVIELTSSGTLSYASYLGGSAYDTGQGIAAGTLRHVYVTGTTVSTNFPTSSPSQTNNAGDNDVFVTAIDPNRSMGFGYIYSTYHGGTLEDVGYAIAVSGDTAFVTGYTYSTNFPVTLGAAQSSLAGSRDAFVTVFNSNGTIYSCTYLGGSYTDIGYGIAAKNSKIYVTGYVDSTNFPTVSPYQGSLGGGADAFVSIYGLNRSNGYSLEYSTYLGGSSNDGGRGIAADSNGYVYVAGLTISTNFPTVSAFQGTKGAGADAFVTKLNTSGVSYSSYLGGNDTDEGMGIAVDGSGNAYVSGDTNSTNFPTASPYQSSNAGLAEAFVSKIAP